MRQEKGKKGGLRIVDKVARECLTVKMAYGQI